MIINITTGRIVKSLEAFKGSKPIYSGEGILIVRGVCRDKNFDNYDSIKDYLVDKLKENGFEVCDEIDVISFVDRINEKLGENSAYQDNFGFEVLKKSFENMGCECDYIVGKKGELMVGISMWYDKNTKSPKFVEVVCC